MTLFALEERQVRELVAGVRTAVPVEPDEGPAQDAAAPGGAMDRASAADAFARVAWSVLAEPGDEDAGLLVAALGAGPALELLRVRAEAAAVEAALDGVGAVDRPRDLARSLARWAPRCSAQAVIRAVEQATRIGASLVLPGDPDWPTGLAGLGPAAPSVLWLRGDRRRLPELERSVAVVGARAATGYGEHMAIELAAGLAERGLAVLSGGAYGIDAAAHRGALAAEGTTAAVLAGGLDRFYPAGNDELFTRILGSGLVLGEVPPGTPPIRMRFLARNRLLAAIARAVVVVEAGLRSGSLNTAGHAAQIGRPIGAVPGPVTSPASAGCHRLLKGEFPAACVTGIEDVLALLGAPPAPEPGFDREDPRVLRVLDVLRPRAALPAAEVARRAGLAEQEALAVLGPLELEGRVRVGTIGWTRVEPARPVSARRASARAEEPA